MRFMQRCFGLLSMLLLSACVTTETGIFTEKANPEQALASSIHLAKKYISERQWGSAKRHLKVALDLDDESPEVHEAMALVFQNTGEIEKADTHYREAISLDKNFSRARLNYAAYLYRFNRYQEAIEQLEEVTKDPLYDKRDMAFMNLGRCYLAVKNYEKAEDNFRRAYLMIDRHSPFLLLQMAEVYYQLKEYPKSQRFFDRYSLKSKVKSSEALWLGVRLAQQFDDKNAISSYGLALKNLYPRSQEYLLYMREFEHGRQ